MSDLKLTKMGDHLARHGAALLDQGYAVIPIKVGEKRPNIKGWTGLKPTKQLLADWLENGYKHAGIGILTKYTCAIDIDCGDESAARLMEAWCLRHIGPAPVRIGRYPRRLLVYRTSDPFSKQRTTKYQDDWVEIQQIEFLGDGQQFAAYHVHPKTGKEYEWIGDRSPLNWHANDLSEIKQHHIDALKDYFKSHAEEMKWEVVSVGRALPSGNVDADNPFIEDASPIHISIDELRGRLMLIDVDKGGYDQWLQMGMALYHQFDGEEIGFDLWNEWSETSDDYDLEELESKWDDFSISGKGRSPITARYILRVAKETVEKTNIESLLKLKDTFINAKTLEEWEKARQEARHAEIDSLNRSSLAAIAKERRDAITGTKTSLVEIKKALSYIPKKNEKMPQWCVPWVYDVSDDKFFNIERQISCSQQGFNAMHDRQAMTRKDILDGKNAPTQTASALALNHFQIVTVEGRRYMPGRDPVFVEVDGKFANTYAEHEIPKKPEIETPKDEINVKRVKKHLEHLLKEPEEQRMLLDWISWVVQNPGRHMNYAVLLQGVEGDGKTFFAELMRATMGVSNVTMLNAHILNSDFTDWAAGQCVACIEEVRIVGERGKDKYAAVNRIKPFITNHIIEVHPKGAKIFNCVNTTSYMLFSNYKDALPLNDNSRRYLVLFSKWQRKGQIDLFKENNPTYYTKLYAAIQESPGALREWLLAHEQEEGFNPMGDAPETKAKKIMVRKAKPEFIQVLEDIIAEDEWLCASDDLVNTTDLSDILATRGVDMPSAKTLTEMLDREGYEFLGRVRISSEERGAIYSRNADLFRSEGTSGPFTDTTKIRNYLKKRKEQLDDDL